MVHESVMAPIHTASSFGLDIMPFSSVVLFDDVFLEGVVDPSQHSRLFVFFLMSDQRMK